MNTYLSGMGFLSTLIGSMLFIGVSALFVLTGIIYVATIEKLRTYGAQNIYTLDVQISSVRSAVSESLLTFKTSNAPYCASFPDRGDRIGFGGFRKYTKCAQQLAAYRLALRRTHWLSL